MEEREKTNVVHRVEDLIAKALGRSGSLLVLRAPEGIGRVHRLEQEETFIGRASGAEIVIDDEGVSRRHAKVQISGNQFWVVDLGSTNGTVVNGNRVNSWQLSDGDRIQLGPTVVLKFQLQDSADEESQKELYESATRDGLTRAFNKKYFLEALDKDFAWCKRHGKPSSLVLIDIDHFKLVNDTYGHQAGDFVLNKLSARLLETIRKEDLFARYGGEEFMLLLRQLSAREAFLCAERLRVLIEKTEFVFNGRRIPLTFSAGTATFDGTNFPDVLSYIEAADKHLYEAKAAGRNRVGGSSG